MEREKKCCSHCHCPVGEKHTLTGQLIRELIVNHEKDAYICFDCVARCVSIMATGEKISDD